MRDWLIGMRLFYPVQRWTFLGFVILMVLFWIWLSWVIYKYAPAIPAPAPRRKIKAAEDGF